jgi:peptidoglycan/LPS O-acetylase OafA/YrhL
VTDAPTELSSGLSPAGPGDQRQPRLRAVDLIRGTTALLIVAFHIMSLPNESGDVAWNVLSFIPMEPQVGVTVFLVLSGFCIHLPFARRLASGNGMTVNWGHFWTRRFVRCYIPYVPVLILSIFTYYVLIESLGFRIYDFQRVVNLPFDVVAHIFLVQNLFKDTWLSLGNVALWSLALQFQLYALYPLFIVLRRQYSVMCLLLLSFAITMAYRISLIVVPFLFHWSSFPTFPGPEGDREFNWPGFPFAFLFPWVLGALAAETYVGMIALPEWCYRRSTIALLLLASCLTHFRTLFALADSMEGLGFFGSWALSRAIKCLQTFSVISFGMLTFVILNRWLNGERQGRLGGRYVRMLVGLGIISYSLYLIHNPVIWLIEWLLQTGGPKALVRLGFGSEDLRLGYNMTSFLVRLVVMIPASLAVAWVFFRVVEYPCLVFRSAWSVGPVTGLRIGGEKQMKDTKNRAKALQKITPARPDIKPGQDNSSP